MARRVRDVAVDPLDAELRWDALARWARRLPFNFDPPLSEEDSYFRRKMQFARLAHNLRAAIVDPAERVAQFEAQLADTPWPGSANRSFLDSAPKAVGA